MMLLIIAFHRIIQYKNARNSRSHLKEAYKMHETRGLIQMQKEMSHTYISLNYQKHKIYEFSTLQALYIVVT